jgi:hypothetical protein
MQQCGPGLPGRSRRCLLRCMSLLVAQSGHRRTNKLRVIQPNFADDIEIRPFGLDHEKLTHRHRILK